jgi:hypothetical protein
MADHFNDPHKAYAIIEQVRGRSSGPPGGWICGPVGSEANRADDLSIATKTDGGAIDG